MIDRIGTDRLFVIVVEVEGQRDPEHMPLLHRTDGTRRLTPVFSSMRHATSFLSGAQELGHVVKLDYIFPMEKAQLARDFPEYELRLDPSPATFFSSNPQ